LTTISDAGSTPAASTIMLSITYKVVAIVVRYRKMSSWGSTSIDGIAGTVKPVTRKIPLAANSTNARRAGQWEWEAAGAIVTSWEHARE